LDRARECGCVPSTVALRTVGIASLNRRIPPLSGDEFLGNAFAHERGRMAQNNTVATSRKRGRPRGGVRPGERLRDYPVLTVRVPPDTRAMFAALCLRRRVPRWLMLRHLIVCFVRNLPANERRRIVQRSKAA
jgi:hypothetical protein